MKKNDTLNAKGILPKKSTVDFLLKFSKSIAIIPTREMSVAMLKN